MMKKKDKQEYERMIKLQAKRKAKKAKKFQNKKKNKNSKNGKKQANKKTVDKNLSNKALKKAVVAPLANKGPQLGSNSWVGLREPSELQSDKLVIKCDQQLSSLQNTYLNFIRDISSKNQKFEDFDFPANWSSIRGNGNKDSRM